MPMPDDQRMLQLFESMNKHLQTLAQRLGASGNASASGGGGSGGPSKRRERSPEEQQARLNRLIARSTKLTEQELNETAKGQRITRALRAALDDYTRTLQDSALEFTGLQRGTSLLGESLIKSHKFIKEGSQEFQQYMEDLGDATKPLGDRLLEQAGIVDKTTKQLRKDIGAGDFAKFRTSLVAANETINEGISNLGFGDFQSLVGDQARLSAALNDGSEAGKKLKAAMLATAARLERAGFDTGQSVLGQNGAISANAASTVNYSALATQLGSLQQTIGSTVNGMSNVAARSNSYAGTVMNNIRNSFRLSNVTNSLTNHMSGLTSSTQVLNATFQWAKKNYEDLVKFNIAQVPASFLEVTGASIRMGMSFEETTKFMQENKRVLAMYGPSAFGEVTSSLKGTFEKFGFNMKQAAEVVGPAIESGISAGINTRSLDQLNGYIGESMNQFQNISGIVNVTAGEFMKMKADLLGSHEVQATLLGLSRDEARAKSDAIMATHKQYVQMGLNTQQAAELLKLQEKQSRAPVKERLREAAKLQMYARAGGLGSEEANRLRVLSSKGQLSEPEQQEQARLLAQVNAGIAEGRRAAYAISEAAGQAFDTQTESFKPGGPLGSALESATKIAVAGKAGTQIKDAEAEKIRELAKGNEELAKFSNALNSVTSFLGGNFTGGLSSVLSSLAGGALTQLALRGGGAALGAGGLGAAASGLGAAGSAALAGAGTAALWTGGVAAAGAAGYAAGTYVVNPILDKAASLVTGNEDETFGTGIYEGVDKVMGWFGKSDADKMREAEEKAKVEIAARKAAAKAAAQPVTGSPVTPPQPVTATPVTGVPTSTAPTAFSESPSTINTAAETKKQTLFEVSDATSHSKLTEMVTYLSTAVALLQTMNENSLKQSSATRAASYDDPSLKPGTVKSYIQGF
jgi:hypothetical protein